MTFPLVWPREGASSDGLATSLRDVLNKVYNVPLPTEDPVTAYSKWATDSVIGLMPWLTTSGIDRLIRTPTYWAILAMPTGTERGMHLVNEEMAARRQDLERVVTSIEQFARRFQDDRPTQLIIPDTNVLLEHPEPLAEADWSKMVRGHVEMFDDLRVIIPLLVIDELDNAKRISRTRSRARTTLKTIYDRPSASITDTSVLQPATASRGAVSFEVLMEAPTHSRLPRADDELIRIAGQLSSFLARPVIFVSYDTGAALRAGAAQTTVSGLRHIRLQDNGNG